MNLDVLDGRDFDVICVTENKWKGNDTTDLPVSWVDLWAGVPESKWGCHDAGVLLSFRLVSAVALERKKN